MPRPIYTMQDIENRRKRRAERIAKAHDRARQRSAEKKTAAKD